MLNIKKLSQLFLLIALVIAVNMAIEFFQSSDTEAQSCVPFPTATERFGGMFDFKVGPPQACVHPNPLTGDCTCPTGYTPRLVGTYDATIANAYNCSGPCIEAGILFYCMQ